MSASGSLLTIVLRQWWQTYGTRARGGTHSHLCGHAHRLSSTEFVIRKVKRRGARLLPRSGQPPESRLLRQGEVVNVPVLNQKHLLTQHVTSEIFPLVTLPLVITLFWFWTGN